MHKIYILSLLADNRVASQEIVCDLGTLTSKVEDWIEQEILLPVPNDGELLTFSQDNRAVAITPICLPDGIIAMMNQKQTE
jgi:hypothetical protein